MKQGNTPPSRQSGGTRGIGRAFVRKATVAVASLAMFAPFVVSGTAYAAPTDPVEVVVNGADVDTAKGKPNGLSFKGFGVLSANSTSSLLMDYKSQNPDAYWQMINVLFGGDNPIMNTVKIEMGNDQNTSTGPNAATMRSADEYPNVAHEPGFQLAADALKVNPNVKVSILRWRSPAWVRSNDDVYHWYKNTILAVYRQYGYMVDSVNPHINESGPNLEWTKDFANRVKTDKEGFIGAGTIKDLNGGEVLAWSSDTEKELFHKIRTVISDEVGTGSFGDDMLKDEDLRKAVDIAGYHYNTADQGNNFKTLADQYDKEIWNSEAQATFSVTADRPNNTMNLGSGEGNGTNNGQNNGTSGTGIGGINSALEMANTYVKGFTSSRRTNFVYQPAISAFYDGFQYSSKEVITMHDPWSGAINWDGALAVLEQVSRFAKTGYDTANNNADIWRGISQASRSDITDGNPPGRGNGGNSSRGGATSYMTLAAPDKSDFSTVIVNDSQYTKTYRIKAQDMNLGDDATMELWETRAADEGEAYNANYVKPFSELQPGADGYYEFQVKPWSIVTATTLDNAENNGGALTAREGKGSQVPTNKEYVEGNDYAVLDTDDSGDVNGKTDNELLYADDFEYTDKKVTSYDPKTGKDVTQDYLESRGGDTGATPRYTNDTNGAFEVVKQSDGNHVMRQQVGPNMHDGPWNGGAWNGGDPVTTIGDYRWANYEVSVNVLFEADAGNATVGARQWGNSSNGKNDSPAQLRVKPDGSWDLMRFGTVLQSGKKTDNFKTGANQWNTIAVKVLGNVYTAYINGDEVATYTDPQPQLNGRIQLGSSFDFVQFDNLKVKQISGATPYFTDLLDNMHQRSWENNATALLTYNEKWQHLNGQGMFVYKRSVSKSTAQGATLTYTFNGTGIDLLGANNGKAKLNVTVDGTKIAASAETIAADAGKPTTYALRGLKDGQHTVTFETATGDAISIDAVGVVKATADGSKVDVAPLKTAVDSYADLKADDWNSATWAVFSANLDAAKDALDDAAAYGLDTEGAQALIDRLAAARKGLVDASISETVQNLGFTGVAAVKTDAAALPAKLAVKDGKETAVTWDDDAAAKLAAAADYSKVTLSGVTTDKQADGSKYRFTVEVEAIPANVTYFIDSGTDGKDSPEYTAVKAAVPGLSNDKVDQTSDGTTWGYDANAMRVKSGMDINDKQSTGIYSDDDDVTYYLPLKAGKYKLTAGFQEWWDQENRESAQAVIAADGTTLATGDNLKLGKANPNLTGTVEFTVPTEQTVKYVVSKVGNAQRPVISWLGVAAVADYGLAAAVVKGTDLPAKVTVDGLSFDVKAWDESAKTAVANAADYSKVTVSGTKADGMKFSTVVEVIPSGVQYFIDSGTNGKDSPEYTAVKTAVPGLRNDKVDQTSDGSTWGYNADGQNTYGSGDINDKFSTGLWAGKGRSTIYYLPLPAGTYTVSAGFHEWWNQGRNMKVFVLDGEGKELSNGNADISGTMDFTSTSNAFTLKAPQTVTLKVDGVSADPVISWVAVAGTVDESYVDKTALNKAIADAKALDPADYTADSWKGVADALAEAETVAANDKATKAEVDAVTTKLTDAVSELVDVQFDDLGVIAAVSGKDLPTSVAGKTVAWSKASADAFKAAALYTTVEVKGTVDNAPVKATVEVIPDGLQYFIDSGTTDGAVSPEYTAVKAAVPGLLNDKVDQTSDGSTWGYDATGQNVKSNTDINDKWSTGLWAGADTTTYYLPLKAGTYTLTAGFRDWWKKERPMTQVVYAANGDKLADGAAIDLSATKTDATGTVDFTVDSDQTVKYVVSKSAAEKPVISWLAVAKQADAPAVDKGDLNDAIDAADKLNLAEGDYTGDSWDAYSAALDKAKEVAADTTATQEEVNAAVKALDEGLRGLAFTPKKLDGEVAAGTIAVQSGEVLAGDVFRVTVGELPDVCTAGGSCRLTAFLYSYPVSLGDVTVQTQDGTFYVEVTVPAGTELGKHRISVLDGRGALVALADVTVKEKTVPQPADKSALQARVDEVGKWDPDAYTTTSWNRVQDKLTAAKGVLADGSATQDEVDKALDDLNKAVALLERVPSGGGTTVITKKQVSITGVTAADAWFDGKAHAGFEGTPSSDFKGTYEVTYSGSGSTVYGPSKDAPTAAGTYRVTISVPSSDSTWYGSLALEFSIRSGSTVVGRFYAPGQDRHMWTASAAESGVLPGMGWNREGDAFTMDGHTGEPVYRLYDGRGNQHLWTTSTTERDHLVSQGWNDEGIAFYENPTAKIDVFRLYNPWTGEHLWTTSILERDSLTALSNGAWTYEGVAFKALA